MPAEATIGGQVDDRARAIPAVDAISHGTVAALEHRLAGEASAIASLGGRCHLPSDPGSSPRPRSRRELRCRSEFLRYPAQPRSALVNSICLSPP